MNSNQSAIKTGLGEQVIHMIQKHGSPEEKRIIGQHQQRLVDFLNHPDTRLRLKYNLLDIGLENDVTLKFNLIANSRLGSPLQLINQFAVWAPELEEISEAILRHNIHAHAGIKISSKGMEYELYPYETPEGLLEKQFCARFTSRKPELPATPYCYGFSSFNVLSAYAQVEHVPEQELEQALGFSLPASNLKKLALFHSRADQQGKWHSDKAGIEFLPFPSHLLNAAMTHCNLGFAYLVHRGGKRRYGVIGIRGARQVLYTTLLPDQPRKKNQ